MKYNTLKTDKPSIVGCFELVESTNFNQSDLKFPKSDFYFKSGINSLRNNIISPEFMIMSSQQVDELIVDDIVDITVSSNYLGEYCNYNEVTTANSSMYAVGI
jgi:hypothetical protein